jgi:hypothetical protein
MKTKTKIVKNGDTTVHTTTEKKGYHVVVDKDASQYQLKKLRDVIEKSGIFEDDNFIVTTSSIEIRRIY